ncbi:hypothetical protein Pyn_13081 [Prunus yedoensis var. nudiflora]|uniref:Cystatin domain-containing protein n=1 Tax=Prunus yedoensis var. nudiflora TaxID=2094558 RepID=A0A314U8A2_PRUYE|nr:hypothetical protein Pyn_13081 [Prunus yedoensis var. nudiflora]
MYPHCFLTLILMITLLIPLATASATTNRYPGAWMPVNTSDPVVVEKGKWAVLEYNKKVTNKLVFQRVVSGETIYISGIFYGLVVAAKKESLPNPPENYHAGVWAKFFEPLKLRTFYKGN